MTKTRRSLLWASVVVTLAPVAFGQSTFSDEKYQVSPYIGPSIDHVDAGANSPFATGVVLGVRVAENFWQRFGFEQSLGYDHSKFEILNPQADTTFLGKRFNNGITNFHFDGLLFFTDRGSKWRPYLAAGLGGAHQGPSNDASNFFKSTYPKSAPNGLGSETNAQYNWGGGVFYRLTNLLSLRGDIREFYTRPPSYGIVNLPNSAILPRGNWIASTQTTGSLVLNFGGKAVTPHTLTADPITATPLAGTAGLTQANPTGVGVGFRFSTLGHDSLNHPLGYQWMVNGAKAGDDSNTFTYTPTQPGAYRVEVQVTDKAPKKPAPAVSASAITVYEAEHKITLGPITANPPNALIGPGANGVLNASDSVGPGTTVRLTAQATDSLGHKLRYEWTVNGQPAGDGSNVLVYTTRNPGRDVIGLRVSDPDTSAGPPAPAVSDNPVTVYVRDTRPPTATSCAANPATVTLGQSVTLNFTPSVAQGNTARVRWTVTEGAVSNAATAQTTFNSSSVSFPQSPMAQTKTITATATVTDDSGATANCTTTIRVTTEPQTVHYGDILFGENSARVNNAAKRTLVERLYPQLTGDFRGYTLVLVGHSDRSERGMRNIDRRRVMDAAAVLTAAKGSCMSLEPSRIMADWVGTDDTEYKETEAGSAVRERAADTIRANDTRAKNRRVELWLVPSGKPMPASVKQARPLPTDELAKLGCPQ